MTDKNQRVSRRRFIGGAAVAGAATLAMPEVSRAETATLKMQGSWAPGDIFNDYAMQLVDTINDLGGSRLKIDYLTVGAVVKTNEVQDAVSNGVLDAGHLVPAYWYGKNRAASLFGTGPCFGWDTHGVLAWFYGPGKDLYKELTQDILGLNIVGWFHMPQSPQPLGWFNKEITSIDDMQNLKYRTVGLAANVMQELGCKVTQLPGGEIVPAMEKHVIDAFEYSNPTSDFRFGAPDVAKYYMLSSYHQANECLEFEINKDRWNGLAQEQQAIINHSVQAANSTNLQLAYSSYADYLQQIKEAGVTVKRTPQSVLSAQLDAWDKVAAQYGQDAFFQKVIDSQREFAKNRAYCNIMMNNDFALAYTHYFGDEQPLEL
ncbi:MAG: twin-arginine translocation signal domain-containing protein [Limimaricola sp.]|uniref:TRAP transporter substrate-binding protein n=1 Tax=Limimaricola sp. TaxID=2211665 RepID=UPI001DDDE7B7|nr:TRAP transporter substrate-binding protein [Limimaricola sp.]MBI1416225.1 twin-arginine translocation signal domain-containing protein [Limimaricola sp.]